VREDTQFVHKAANKVLPTSLSTVLVQLFLDKATGNVQVNIKDGVIRGFRVDQIYAVD